MKTSYALIFLLFTHISFSQLVENFSDGDFKNNPVWLGDTAFFKVNSSFNLQSKGPSASGNIQLYTNFQELSALQWEFLVRLDFEPSTTNYAKVYLTSDQPNLKSNLNGYFLKIGGESGISDRLELYRQEGVSTTKLLSGIAGNVGRPINTIRIKILRDYSGSWTLYSDTSGGSDFSLEGYAQDQKNSYSESYFGFQCIHTSTRKDLFFFDDINIGPPPLFATSAEAISDNEIQVTFSKALNENFAEESSGYHLIGVGFPSSASLISQNTVLLSYPQILPKGPATFTFASLIGADGSGLVSNSLNFQLAPPLHYGDILITEIYPDPTPSNGMTEEEFVEIYNNTTDTIVLSDFIYGDGSLSGKFPDSMIYPGEYLILCPTGAINFYKEHGKTCSFSPWPSLNNSGDYLFIKDPKGKMIFEATYSNEWYQDEEKSEGGWSLEMINFMDYCSATNWRASESESGASPGKLNSVFSSQNDTLAPVLKSINFEDSLTLLLSWNEELDTLYTPIVTCDQEMIHSSNYSGNKSIRVSFSQVPAGICKLKLEQIRDCKGNQSPDTNLQISFPEKENPFDVIINEVLFNPRPGGVDFIEIYNRSSKILDLKNWKIVSLKGEDSASCKPFSSSMILNPGDYLVFCPSVAKLQSQYYVPYPERLTEQPELPGFNDDKGSVLLINSQNIVQDRFDYNEDYHLKTLQDKEGVSLERIIPDGLTNTPSNWHSAANSHGFATPGFKNSQHQENQDLIKPIKVDPKVFSPDQDGNKDFTMIHYQFEEPGFICNLSVFDQSGRKFASLAENYLAGTEGFFQWEGTDIYGGLAPTGLYIVFLEAYNSKGKSISWKGTVIITRSSR